MSRVFIIAEAGVNHNGDIDLARQLIRIARDCGADAVKFQTFRAEDLVTLDAPAAEYQTRNAGVTTQFDMLKKLELPESWHIILKAYADSLGIEFFSTPFSESAVDLLTHIGVKRIKLSSGELTNKPLLRHAAATGLPMILSTGMGTLKEVELAVSWISDAYEQSHGERMPSANLWVMHCTSNYPAASETLNLNAITTLTRELGLPVGYSDHSLGETAAIAAVALGAMVIEKHITFDKNAAGPDHPASCNEVEFSRYVKAVREASAMLGNGIKTPNSQEMNTLLVARRSVVASRSLSPGHLLVREDLHLRRPSGGIEPAELDSLLGRRLLKKLDKGEQLAWDYLEAGS